MNKLQKSLLVLFALVAFGQTAWAQMPVIANSESDLRTYLSNGTTNSIRLENNIKINNGDLVISNEADIIDLNGHTINCQIYQIKVTTYGNLTIQNNDTIVTGTVTSLTTGSGSLFDVSSGCYLHIEGGIISAQRTGITNGGAIYNAGTLTLEGGTITGGNATNGGCVYNAGTMTFTDGTITDGNATNGGGVYNAGTMTLDTGGDGGSIENCTATSNGGGVYNAGTLTIKRGTIGGIDETDPDNPVSLGNTASNQGGAIYNDGGTVTINGGSISDNTAQNSGGIFLHGGDLTLTGGTISNNTANGNCGGVSVSDNSTMTMSGGSIANNTANNRGGMHVGSSSTFTMTGGSISGNTATNSCGGINMDGTFIMSGNPIVMGNTANGNSENVCLPEGKVITVDGAFTSGASVGVTCAGGAGTTFTSGYNSQSGSVFASDNTAYTVTIENGEARLVTYYPTGVSGDIQYLNVDANGDHGMATCSTYTKISTLTDNGVTLSNGWYVVDENLTFNSRITISGTVNLILMDNTRLTANKGIYVPYNTTLHIWAQSADSNDLGCIVATANEKNYAGIGGHRSSGAGRLYFHGGACSGIGGMNAAGINGAAYFGENYSVNIYGGNVFGIGGDYGAGIGGGFRDMCGSILITGGTVIGIGGIKAAGIGSGYGGKNHDMQGGYSGNPGDEKTFIRITGGDVTGWGTTGAGIGGGVGMDTYDGDSALVYIEGGTVEATTMDGTPLTSRGAIAIGWGCDYMFSGGDSNSLEIYKGAKVSASTDNNGNYVLQTADNGRSNYRTYKKMKIEPCDHPNGTNYSNNGNSLNVGCNHCYATEPYTFTTAGNWNTAGNWLGSIMPGEGKDVAVKAAATIPSNCCAHVGHIDMQEGGSLTIADGGQLKHSNAVAGTMQKFIAGYDEISNPAGWYLLGAPLCMDSVLAVNSGMVDLVDNHADFTTHGVDLYEFIQSQDLEWRNMRVGNHFRTMGITLNAAYLYARADDCTLNFSTTEDELFAPTTTDTYIAVTRATTTPEPEFVGWNLIRNPYTCNAYLASGRDFYRMNATGDAIVLATADNGGTAIKPCEGIFVVVAAENDPDPYLLPNGMPFPNAAKIRFTTTEPAPSGSKGLLDITVKQEGRLADVARVRFDNGDRTGKLVLRDNATRLSIMQDGKECSVVHNEAQGEMPVNFKAKENGTYTLTVNPEGVEMGYLHLIDNMTGADVDLLATPTYTFSAKTTDYASRFKLVFSANTEDGPSTGSGTFAFISDGEIRLLVETFPETSLQIVDMLGRVVVSRRGDVSGNVSTSGMTAGVYVLRLINGDDVKTQKMVIQ